jgi:hypothetical protein
MNAFAGRSARISSVATMLAGLMLVAVPEGWAQQKAGDAKQQIVGLWRLVSVVNVKDGVTKAGSSFGPTPAGRLVFTSSGHYVSFNTNPNLPKFASGNRAQGTAEENKAVVQALPVSGPIQSAATAKRSP